MHVLFMKYLTIVGLRAHAAQKLYTRIANASYWMLTVALISRSTDGSRLSLNVSQVRYWDVIIFLLLVFTATVTPFEVAYLDPHLDGESASCLARLPVSDGLKSCHESMLLSIS